MLLLDRVQGQTVITFPPIVTYALVALDEEVRDAVLLEARGYLHADLTAAD